MRCGLNNVVWDDAMGDSWGRTIAVAGSAT